MSASAKPASPPPAARRLEPPACRVLRVTGSVRRQGTAVGAGDVIDGRGWLELEKDASLAVKHAESGRELAFVGPGHVLPCRRGEEQVLLAAGRFQSTSGAGVRPGAEVLVATPAGIVRYGDAELDVVVAGRRARVTARSGEARLEPAKHAVLKGKPVIAAPTGSAELIASPRATADALEEDCRQAAAVAAEAARAVLRSAADGGSLGERAAAQLRARQAARAACATAAAAAAGVADVGRRAAIWARIEHSERLWQAVPRTPGPETRR